MSMTQADFYAVAGAVAQARATVLRETAEGSPERAAALETLEQVTTELARACQDRYRGGYSFGVARFRRACGED
jgi:hypothetical protein